MENEIQELLKKIDIVSYHIYLKKEEVKSNAITNALNELLTSRIFHFIIKNIDEVSAEKLKKIQTEMRVIEREIKKLDWILTEDGCIKNGNYKNVFTNIDWNVYLLQRRENGFHPTTNPINDYFFSIYEVEKSFLVENRTTFDYYHSLASEKEAILEGSYQTINDNVSKEDLVSLSNNFINVKEKESSRQM